MLPASVELLSYAYNGAGCARSLLSLSLSYFVLWLLLTNYAALFLHKHFMCLLLSITFLIAVVVVVESN